MNLKEIIEEKIKRLETIPDAFTSSIVQTEKEYFSKLLKVLSRLETSDGKLIVSKTNLDLVAQIEGQLKNLFLDTDFKDQVKKFLSEFDSQAALNKSYFEKSFPDHDATGIAQELIKRKKQSVANLLLGDNLDAQFINPIKQQINLAVESGASFSETLTSIQRIVTGDSDVDSKILTYSKQVAFDSFAVADRTYTKAVSDELEAEWFKWAGGLLPGSRSLCIENHNKFFHKKEIQAMAEKEWSGKMEGTNSETIFVTAGGYGCKHSVLPVSVFAVPADVIRRNIENGNFTPSEKELALLGS